MVVAPPHPTHQPATEHRQSPIAKSLESPPPVISFPPSAEEFCARGAPAEPQVDALPPLPSYEYRSVVTSFFPPLSLFPCPIFPSNSAVTLTTTLRPHRISYSRRSPPTQTNATRANHPLTPILQRCQTARPLLLLQQRPLPPRRGFRRLLVFLPPLSR